MLKVHAIMQSLLRVCLGDDLLAVQLFEAVHTASDIKKVQVPPHLVDVLAEERLLAWSSKEEKYFLDPSVADVIKRLPYKEGEVTVLYIMPT